MSGYHTILWHGGTIEEQYASRLLESDRKLTAANARIAELEARLGEDAGLKEKSQLAYGWLWHSFTDDHRIHAARRALADVLDRDMRLAGIEASKAAGAAVEVADILAANITSRA